MPYSNCAMPTKSLRVGERLEKTSEKGVENRDQKSSKYRADQMGTQWNRLPETAEADGPQPGAQAAQPGCEVPGYAACPGSGGPARASCRDCRGGARTSLGFSARVSDQACFG